MAIATKQEVLEALAESRKDKTTRELAEIVMSYWDLRRKFDSDYDHGYIDADELADEDDDDADIDFHDEDWITIQWSVSGRCGDHDYYNETFPIEHLWSDDWEADARAQAEAKKEREKREREAYAKRMAEAQEKRERQQLRTLLKKYPDEGVRANG